MKDLYVVNCCRTAIGSFGGALKNTSATEMGAIVAKEVMKRAGVNPADIDEVMFGDVLSAGLGQNVARQVAVKAGVPYSVPAYTVNMVCGSGMKTMIEAARTILAGDAEMILCGGTESMSQAPFASPDTRWGARMGDKKIVDTMIKDGLWDAYNNYHMGTTAENINDIWGITREEQDAFAAASQQKTEASQAAGKFDDEIVAVLIKVKDGYSAQQVASNITKTTGIKSLGYVYPGGITATTKSNLNVIIRYVTLFVAVFWVMGLIVLLAVFSSAMNERKREFAAYRILGANRSTLVGIIVKESAMIGALGGVIGIAVASLAIFPFSTLIGRQLQLPYLQTNMWNVLALIAVSFVFAVLTGLLASVTTAVKLSAPETYLTLREGE